MKKLITLAFFIFSLISLQAQIASDHINGEILVSFAPNLHPNELLSRMQIFENVPTNLKIKKKVAAPMNIWLLSFDGQNIDEDEILHWFRVQPEVKIAQFNHYVHERATVPNDTFYNKQWQWDNTGINGGTVDADVDAPEAWDITTGGFTKGGDTIVVAILDNGIDTGHIDLKENLWVNKAEIPKNGIDDDKNGYIDDYLGWNPNTNNDNIVATSSHGTNVAGMVGAKGNNKTGVTGINWNVKMMIIRRASTLSDEALVLASYAYPYTMRKAYNESNGKKGAFVVATNASWGIDKANPVNYPIWCSFYDTLGTVGILSVGATSNNGSINVDTEFDMPTACSSPYLLTVQNSSTTDNNVSGFGKTTIDVAAPGNGIYTTSLNGSYISTSGTSFSSPLVAGLIGLLYAAPCDFIAPNTKKNPAEMALQMKQHILNGVDLIPSLKDLNVTGGRVNAFKALQEVAAFCSSCVPPSNNNIAGKTFDAAIDVSWTLPDSALKMNVRWREIGAATWTENKNLTATLSNTNLKNCTEYEYQFQSICANAKTSAWSKSYIFRTTKCCVAPIATLNNFAKNGMSVEWDDTFGKSFDVRYRKTGTVAFTVIPSQKSPFKLTNLDSCQSYDVQMRTICDAITTPWSATVIGKTIGCGQCIDTKYCKSSSFSSTFEYIKRVKFNSINNPSTGTNTSGITGYGDFTKKTTTVKQGSSYDLELTPGYNSTFLTDVYFNAWIDYNQDGFFDPNDELVFDSDTTTTKLVKKPVDIPWFAKIGGTRMRVGMRAVFSGQAPEMAPCDTIQYYGEFEDYCLTIASGFEPCKQVGNLSLATLQGGVATIKWDTVPGVISYNIRYRPFDQTEWKVENTASKGVFKVNGIPDCKKYEIQVRTVCSNDLSGFSPSIFAESCTTPTIETNPDIAHLNVYPVPFDNFLYTEFSLTESQDVKLEVFNTAGQQISLQKLNNLAANRHKVRITGVESWASGIYWVKISTQNGATTKKIVKF